MRSLHQAAAIAAMCLNEEPSVRPLISDVVTALSFLNPMNQDQQVLSPIDMPSPTHSATLSLLDDDSAVERQRAIEWGSNSMNKPRLDSASSI